LSFRVTRINAINKTYVDIIMDWPALVDDVRDHWIEQNEEYEDPEDLENAREVFEWVGYWVSAYAKDAKEIYRRVNVIVCGGNRTADTTVQDAKDMETLLGNITDVTENIFFKEAHEAYDKTE